MESFNKHQLTMTKEMSIEKLNLLELRDNPTAVDTASVDSFTSLPLDILWEICDICDVKDQLSLAKVCKLFCQLVSKILARKYQNFVYNYINFKFSLNLDDEQVSQLCLLSGENVTHLRFSTFFNMDLLRYITWLTACNPLENLIFFINDNFQQNLKYFPNLLELEIEGKFVQDTTFLELAKRCRKLTSIRLIDGDNRWLWGKHLADLESIEHLELKSCRNLDPKHLNAVSEKRPLKTLNIVECEHLKDVPIMVELCQIWQHLETLRLTAFTQDTNFLKAVLSLPMLKCLQFFWINFMPLQFAENFFAELKENTQKCLSLKSLKFENDYDYPVYARDRPVIDDEPTLELWTEGADAIKRENICISGRLWRWTDKVFENISKAMKSFSHLQSIDFKYCRLLSYEQLQQLAETNKNLKLITIIGCPMKEDMEFHKQWLQAENNCQLKFEKGLRWEDALNLRSVPCHMPANFYRYPVMRSIECQF